MPLRRHQYKKATGEPPGTMVHIGERKIETPKITIIEYDEENFSERVIEDIDEIKSAKDNGRVCWLNVDGIHDLELIANVGEIFDLHPLLLEDVVNTEQRPKLDDYNEYHFVVLKMLQYDEKKAELDIEQVSLILGDKWVLTLQERPGDAFDFVRDRIRNAKGRIRKKGADYLAYALMDAIVDNYFVVLENLGMRIEEIEEDLVQDLTPEMSSEIHRMKRQTINLRHSIWPLREVISGFQRTGSKLITENTAVFLRDLYDHTIQVIDTVETYRDILSGMLDTYLSLTSNRMNEVMKVLTIIATIFIPLTFIAGVYGMNFQHMPELAWKWGYPAVLGVMALVSVVMIIFFKRKKWI